MLGIAGCAYGLPRSWLASTPEKIPEKSRLALVPTGTVLRIKGYATATRGDASCGPLIATFQPEAGRSYVVDFEWIHRGCRMDVKDITEADHPEPVKVQIRSCPNPASAASLFLSKDGYVAR